MRLGANGAVMGGKLLEEATGINGWGRNCGTVDCVDEIGAIADAGLCVTIAELLPLPAIEFGKLVEEGKFCATIGAGVAALPTTGTATPPTLV